LRGFFAFRASSSKRTNTNKTYQNHRNTTETTGAFAIYVAIVPQQAQPRQSPRAMGRSVMNIINSKGLHVGMVTGAAIFDLDGQKIYELKGINIYRLSGELIGHLNDTSGTEKRLDRANDRLFPVEGGRI
jgi:hypothetical protein